MGTKAFCLKGTVSILLHFANYSGTSISIEGSSDWHNLFAITRFRYIEVVFHIFCYF